MIKFKYDYLETQGLVYIGKFTDIETEEIQAVIFLNADDFFHLLDRNKNHITKTQDLNMLIEYATDLVMSYYRDFKMEEVY